MIQGNFLLSDGSTLMHDDSLKLADGTVHRADGSVLMPDGTEQLVDGSLRYPDGTMRLSNGNVILPDMSIQFPNGQVRLPNGSTHAEANKASARHPGHVCCRCCCALGLHPCPKQGDARTRGRGGEGGCTGWNFGVTNCVRSFCAQFVRCFEGLAGVYVRLCFCSLVPCQRIWLNMIDFPWKSQEC